MRQTSLKEIYKLAQRDNRVVFIGSDLGAGTLDEFKRDFPDRFFMEGVSEAHLIGMMAGLAMNGKIPYFNTIATFISRRAYEQVLLDAGLHNQNIRLIASGGGTVYAPLGPTHLAMEDIAVMRTIPNMTIIAPSDAEEMKRLIPQTLEYQGPIYIRLAKGGDPVIHYNDNAFYIGKSILLKQGDTVLLIGTGITSKLTIDASHILATEGISTSVLHVHTIKPFDQENLLHHAEKVKVIITVEEHIQTGGLGSCVAECLAESGLLKNRFFKRIAFPDKFIEKYGSQEKLLFHYGITSENIVKIAKQLLQELYK